MTVAGDALDAALKRRLRAVLDDEPVTEADLRALDEQGRACTLILGALIDSAKRDLERLAPDPASSLAEVAAALQALRKLQPDFDELQELRAALDHRAHEFRAGWASA
jgi:hypothetical protein